jgi:hypothetical protein
MNINLLSNIIVACIQGKDETFSLDYCESLSLAVLQCPKSSNIEIGAIFKSNSDDFIPLPQDRMSHKYKNITSCLKKTEWDCSHCIKRFDCITSPKLGLVRFCRELINENVAR